jgi:hypothetical protein
MDGQCFCGAVGFEVTGEPVAMGYCHCSSCRTWLGAPVHGFTMWPAEAVTMTRGEAEVGTFLKTPDTISHRQHCTRCGGAVMIRHPSLGLIDIPSVAIPGLAFVPQFHVNYAEHVLRMADGLPKFPGFPPDMGGSGELMPE